MSFESHYQCLQNMFLAAPINQFYRPRIKIEEGYTEIAIDVQEKYFHGASSVHGSVYFKMLDDAAYFSANSLELEFFLVTTSFTTYLTKPVSSGVIKAVGRVANKNRSQTIAEAIVYNAKGIEIGRGNGLFVRSRTKLKNIDDYCC